MKLVVQCPAKINLFLSVGPVEPSGYHPIRTVFQAISLYDRLEMETSASDSFVCDWPEMPVDNTVTKAWRLAREYTDLPPLTVSLTKQIPVMSGLGGGSSDAAGFLRGLVKFSGGRFGEKEAAEVARAVGSDVPFFMIGGRARAEGYGEALTPIEDLPEEHLVVAMPPMTVDTRAAYKELDKLPRALREFPTDDNEVDNDFLSVAPKESLEALRMLLYLGSIRGGLAGSGAAVFAYYSSSSQAQEVSGLVSRHGVATAWACSTLGRKASTWIS